MGQGAASPWRLASVVDQGDVDESWRVGAPRCRTCFDMDYKEKAGACPWAGEAQEVMGFRRRV